MEAIRQNGDPVLRDLSAPVAAAEFGTPALTKILKDMEEALNDEKDGVAIAAPQIGVNKRIFLVRYDRMLPPQEEGEPEPAPEVGVFINPKITKRSRRVISMDEGCLSVRGTYGKTRRNERATVRAQDAQGAWFERGGGGVLAQAFQHEIDHLDGILFIDSATDLYDHAHDE